MAANKDSGIKKGYAAPLEGNISAIMSMLKDCLVHGAKMVLNLAARARGPAAESTPAAQTSSSPVKPKGPATAAPSIYKTVEQGPKPPSDANKT